MTDFAFNLSKDNKINCTHSNYSIRKSSTTHNSMMMSFFFQLWIQKIPKSRRVSLSCSLHCVFIVLTDTIELLKLWNIIRNLSQKDIDLEQFCPNYRQPKLPNTRLCYWLSSIVSLFQLHNLRYDWGTITILFSQTKFKEGILFSL